MRNSKFLWLLVILLIGMLGVYMIGCEGDDTTINEPDPLPPPDRVVGSIHGVISNAFDNTPLQGVEATWVSSGDTHTVVSDAKGIYVTDDTLVSGEYVFWYSVSGYASSKTTVTIPDIEDLRGEPGTPISGDIPWSEESNVELLPISARVTGKVYTALPAPGKDLDAPIIAGDSSDLVSPVSGVKVLLEYDWDIAPNRYVAFTDANGQYTFLPEADVPWADSGVMVRVLPFTSGDSSYSSVTRTVNMVHNGTANMANIYTPLDCGDIPEILRANFDNLSNFHYDSSLRLTFSEPMDPASMSITLDPQSDTPWSFTANWSVDDQVLDIAPVLSLLTDTDWELDLTGKSRDGCPTAGRMWQLPFHTLDGIKLISTNLERGPGDFTEFPVNSPIDLTFNMPPVYRSNVDTLTLFDITEVPLTGDSFAVDFSADINGNALTITPFDSLERNHTYRLRYRISSNVQGDHAGGIFTFYSARRDTPPPAPTGFAVDLGITPDWPPDWNTTEISFRWNTVQQADSFKIYAKDNRANSDFIQIHAVPALDHLQYQFTTLELPTQFDLYQNDGIQTPFSGGTEITFAVRGVNSAGLGGFSNALTLADSVVPEFNIIHVSGGADNTAGTSGATVSITLDRTLEYVRTTFNPEFTFVEGGGDESYALSPSDVTWNWNNAYRKDTTGTRITVPAGRCGAGDTFVVTIYDNSGNPYTDMFRLTPYIEVYEPSFDEDDFEAPRDTVCFSITNAPGQTIGWVDYFLWGGTSVIDSALSFRTGTGCATASIDDTLFSTDARVGIRNHNGGFIWTSDVFTLNGLMVTGPKQADIPDTVWDLGGTDSTMIPMSWNSAGIDTVAIWYSTNGGNTWTEYDTVENIGTFDFWPPDLGGDYTCRLAVVDFDNDFEPRDNITFDFNVMHDFAGVTSPPSSDNPQGGASSHDNVGLRKYRGLHHPVPAW